MPDLNAGTTILAMDTPPVEQAEDGTDNDNVSSTVYIAGTPEVGTTFIAPTTGRVRVDLYLLADTDSTTNRIFLSCEVYLGTSAAGTSVASGDDTSAAVHDTTGSSVGTSRPGWRFVSGLTAGATHYVRTVHRVTAGAVSDISHRSVMVTPLS